MTLTASQLALYCGALFILFATPGPVWMAIAARGLSSGFKGVWPLALGVAIGDVIWPLIAILGVTTLVSLYADFLLVLRLLGAAMFITMGLLLIRHASARIDANTKLTTPGILPGFLAGLAVIAGNPKAVLFYMGVLPGFFDLSTLTAIDITLICTASFLVPLIGNIILGAFVENLRRFLQTPERIRRTNTVSGCALIAVGLFIAIAS